MKFSADVVFIQHYTDRIEGVYFYPGDKVTIDSWDLLKKVADKVKIVRFNKQTGTKNPTRIVVHIAGINVVGGIETWAFNFCKLYKDYDITVLYQFGDSKQLMWLSKYANVVLDEGQHIDTDIIIISNYEMGEVLRRTTKKKAYQVFHAVFSDIVERSDARYKKHPLVDEIVCVSEAARQGLLKQTGLDSKVIYNLLDYDIEKDRPLRLFTLSRTAKIKGMGRIMEVVRELRAHNIPFIWFITADSDFTQHKTWKGWLKEYPEIVVIPYNIFNKYLISGFDYLVQLSDTEAFCYSAYEALQRGVPVIITDYEEAFNTIKDGVNGYIVKRDLSDLDVEKIYHNIPKDITYNDRFKEEDWINLFKVD
jgi:glycosyltransferase involved in cell wall biosynthesis